MPRFLCSRIRSAASASRIIFLSSIGIALLGVWRLHTATLVPLMSGFGAGAGAGAGSSFQTQGQDFTSVRIDEHLYSQYSQLNQMSSKIEKVFRGHTNAGKVIAKRFEAGAARQEGFSVELATMKGMLERLEEKLAALEASASPPFRVHFWDDTTSSKVREEILVREGWLEYNGGGSRSSSSSSKENVGGGTGPRNDDASNRPWFAPTDDPAEADIIVWITTMGRHELEKAPLDRTRHYHKVIVLDYSDGCIIHQKRNDMLREETELAYFKRSFVDKSGGYHNKRNCSNDADIIPFSYSGTKAMLIPLDSSLASQDSGVDLFANGVGTVYQMKTNNNPSATKSYYSYETTTDGHDDDYFRDDRYENFLIPFRQRKWTLTSLLNTVVEHDSSPSSSSSSLSWWPHKTRANVVRWTHEICRAKTGNNSTTARWNLPHPGTNSDAPVAGDDPNFAAYVGLVPNGCDGHCFGKNYLRHLRDSKIVVTCNPSYWEGDFRLWESFLSGAMVMIDEMIIPQWMPHPPIESVHFVTYQADNETDFKTKLAYYSDPSNLDETEAIARRGYKHVLEHHMPTNRVDYILNHDRVRSRLIESVTDPSQRATLGFPPVVTPKRHRVRG